MTHRNASDGDFAPRLRRADHAGNFARQLDAGPIAKAEAANVFVKLLLADGEGELGRADVARFYENVLHAQIGVSLVIMQRPPAKIPETVFAKDRRVGTDLALVQGRLGRDDLEGRARVHHVVSRAI